ncbi:MAG: 4'-phosphopantetheinyl transferase superfamily protein [Chitinophagaceae bacterium]|nr:4'-phosphopantetheinyl transferase superfamily protein [Chitinophagaceae bacterium]MCW5926318.1 4'-phosphopantetheinyl transferase superfamily protein [Chitinophagaceae bacterium]
MALFYQHNISDTTRLGIWHIAEPETFFNDRVPLQRSITHPHKRLQHLAGRHLLKTLFPDFPYDLIAIADTKKPYLPNEAYHFSISHCGDYAAAIVSSTERVGIDIEIPTCKVEKVKHKFLHADELEAVEGVYAKDNMLPADSPYYRSLTTLWSAKEAVFKWYGEGEVDFSEHIRLSISADLHQENGEINGAFHKNTDIPFVLPYINFPEITLVWLRS